METTAFDPGAKLLRWESKLENPAKALKQIGEIIVGESLEAFESQAHGGEAWEPRAVPNTFGIIADFAKGGNAQPPARRFEPTPVLTDTGALMRSIAASVSGNTVTVGSPLAYADTLHGGGPIESEPITELVQESLSEWLDDEGSEWRDDLMHLLTPEMTGKTLKGNVVERPIVAVTKQTISDITEMVGSVILEVR